MEIIAGAFRGRRILSPPPEVRPIPVLLRKSMFDILGGRIQGCSFLDGFAGSGIVGIEAISRGAARVDFVESDRQVVRLLEKNLARLGSPDAAMVHAARYEDFLGTVASPYEIIFLDPPYDQPSPEALVELTRRSGVTGPQTLLIVKASTRWPWAEAHERMFRKKVQGSNSLYFFRCDD
ncbi:MAG: 16S rRNA (guanine(966)-N(2))-methyltransferase RsmD [Acidobacteria bacterium]|nr:16S rRNA (guanine(966)-N(2))-methyltransferase RsmD [Acidobacteriota bacterium]